MPDQPSSTDPLAAFGPNEWLVDELYQQYQQDKQSVDKAWWEFFEDYQPGDRGPNGGTTPAGASSAAAAPKGDERTAGQPAAQPAAKPAAAPAARAAEPAAEPTREAAPTKPVPAKAAPAKPAAKAPSRRAASRRASRAATRPRRSRARHRPRSRPARSTRARSGPCAARRPAS